MEKPVRKIPLSFARLFQEYDLDQMEITSHQNVIIERTLELGDWQELKWLFHTYGIAAIKDYLQKLGQRRLSEKAFSYWCQLLAVKDYRHRPFADSIKEVWPH